MEVKYTVLYAQEVIEEDIPCLASAARTRIKTAIEAKLTTAPETYGKPLRRSLKGYRKLRVGDYRVVFRIEAKTVKVFVIQHRRIVYDIANARV